MAHKVKPNSLTHHFGASGVAHGQDLQYVFGLPYFNETYINMTGLRPRQEYDLNDRNISEYMINMFTNFTTRG